jgi:hypothetical protein
VGVAAVEKEVASEAADEEAAPAADEEAPAAAEEEAGDLTRPLLTSP